MSLTLTIPDSVAKAVKLPEEQLEGGLLKELAVVLYAEGYLSFGKARQLARLGKHEFAQLAAEHRVVRHYGVEDLQDDIAYARGQ